MNLPTRWGGAVAVRHDTGDARAGRRAPWLAQLAPVVLLRREPWGPGQQCHGKGYCPAPARYAAQYGF
jgi:hypothetical protein